MGVWGQGSQWAGYDYAQSEEPLNPEEGEMWYDWDSNRSLVYTGVEWQRLDIVDHGQLAGIVEDAHHNPVTVEGPLSVDASQTVTLLLSDGLTLDADGKLRVATNAVTQSMLTFDAATQTELDNHEGDTTNPHNVTDDQTGAASALTNHESDTTNPHNVTDDQTGAAAALSNHASNSTAHHSRPLDALRVLTSGGASASPSTGNDFILNAARVWVNGEESGASAEVTVTLEDGSTSTLGVSFSGSNQWVGHKWPQGIQDVSTSTSGPVGLWASFYEVDGGVV